MFSSAARRLLSVGLLLLLLLSFVSCELRATFPYGTTSGESAPPPSGEELLSRIEASAGESRKSVRAWLSYWGFPSYDTSVLRYMEMLFTNHYVGEIPDTDTIARELGYLFVEYMSYIDLTDPNEVTDLIMECYLVAVGDRYAAYLNPEALDAYAADVEGDFVGIGVHITYREDEEGPSCRIVRVFSGSPAKESGILPGDYLVAVNGCRYPEYDYAEMVDLVAGEVGSAVTITVLRDGVELTYTMERRKVVEETVVGRILPGPPTIGYIRITEFDLTTYSQFTETYERLISLGATRIIFDVRDNPGGLLTAILGVLDYLVPDGVTLARYEYYDGEVASDTASDGHEIPSDLPIVVLTNQATISAGELFASALKDFGQQGYLDVTLVGETTYGKGMMQTMIELPGGRATTISIAYYNPPYSDNYEGVGVIPDVFSSLSPEAQEKDLFLLSDEEDAQLQRALSILLGGG